jgi:hypothetical protein
MADWSSLCNVLYFRRRGILASNPYLALIYAMFSMLLSPALVGLLMRRSLIQAVLPNVLRIHCFQNLFWIWIERESLMNISCRIGVRMSVFSSKMQVNEFRILNNLFLLSLGWYRSRYSDQATCWTTKEAGFGIFLSPQRPDGLWAPPNFLGLFFRSKKCDADHSSPNSVKVNYAWSYTSASPYILMI